MLLLLLADADYCYTVGNNGEGWYPTYVCSLMMRQVVYHVH